jgi:hypothetical protein
MGVRRLAKLASALVLSLASFALMPSTASAWGDRPDWMNYDPSAGYAAPMPTLSQLNRFNVQSTGCACWYTVPIQAVYQCPAALTGQPSSQLVYLRSDPMFGVLGGQPYLYHH